MISASDDKTLKIWELTTGRCTKTVDAHDHFVTCLSWGRTTAKSGGSNPNGTSGADKSGAEERRVNVIATGSVDKSVKIWAP